MATSVRCESDKPLDLVNLTKLPDTVNPKKVSSNPQNPVSLQKTVLCNNCENPCEVERMCDILYKYVMKSTPGDFIPKLISRNHPKMTEKDYLKHKKNVVFLNKKTLVCDDCYLKFTQILHQYGAWTERFEKSPIKQLEPNKLAIRRDITNLTKSLTPIKMRSLSTARPARLRKNKKSKSKDKNKSEKLLLAPKTFPKIPNLSFKRFSEDKSTFADSRLSTDHILSEKRRTIKDIIEAIEDLY